MPDVPPDAIPGLEGYLVFLLSCIVLRRRRAAAHRAQVAPSIVKSRPWERGFTVEGRAPNKHRRARDVFMRNRMRDLSDTEFVRRYKVRKSTFNMMVARLRPELEPDEGRARRSSGSPVTTELQLSMTLRALAGGCYLDIIDMHHVASATFYASFERTVKAINTVFADTIRFPWGDTPALERMSREFYAANGGSLDGCVLAVDGIAIKLQKPTSLDTMNPNQYYCRKGFHALNVQAGCDARLRFRIASIEHVGSTHDSLAWSCTAAAKYMEDDSKLPAPYYFVGDEAYVGSDKMLVPWPGRNLPRAPLNKDGYNYYQSRTRTTIERAFGVLNARFGILWRKLRFKQEMNVHIVRACMRIHNLAIDELGADAAERDARETLHGQMDKESREASATGIPDHVRARNVESERARRSEGERPSRRGERTDLQSRTMRYQVTVALFGKNRPAPRTVGADTARGEERGVFRT